MLHRVGMVRHTCAVCMPASMAFAVWYVPFTPSGWVSFDRSICFRMFRGIVKVRWRPWPHAVKRNKHRQCAWGRWMSFRKGKGINEQRTPRRKQCETSTKKFHAIERKFKVSLPTTLSPFIRSMRKFWILLLAFSSFNQRVRLIKSNVLCAI